ncbi:MAG: RHS repeat domain-containing protein [Clostridia bacterium]
MVQKVLSSKQYGKLTDKYAYNALDQLSSYTGYDGHTQQFTYDANGMRLTQTEAGNGERSTLEELLRRGYRGIAGDH